MGRVAVGRARVRGVAERGVAGPAAERGAGFGRRRRSGGRAGGAVVERAVAREARASGSAGGCAAGGGHSTSDG